MRLDFEPVTVEDVTGASLQWAFLGFMAPPVVQSRNVDVDVCTTHRQTHTDTHRDTHTHTQPHTHTET